MSSMRLFLFASAICGLASISTAAWAQRAPVGCTSPIGCTDACDQCPHHHCCRSRCGCKPPCPPNTPTIPRQGNPPTTIPREGSPPDEGVPTGVYVAPPQTGTIEGPQRGLEFGGISLTMPQITFGTPKIRLQGFSRFARNGHMQLDTAQAPFVQTGVQQSVAQDSGLRSRQAMTDEDEDSPTIPRQATPPDDSTRTRRGTPSCTEDCNQRLDRLEKCVQKQCEALNKCMDLLSRTNCTAPVGGHALHGYRQEPEAYPQTEVPTPSPNVEVIPSSGPSRIPAPAPIPMPPEPERQELGNYQAPPRTWDRQVQQTSFDRPVPYTIPLIPPQILPLPPITEER